MWRQQVAALYMNFLTGKGGAISAHTYDTFPDNDDITLTAHGTADTEGDYTEIISTVGSARVWIVGLHVSNFSQVTDAKITLSTGASGSETARAVVPHRRWQVTAVSLDERVNKILMGEHYSLPFPIHIPSGTREAARIKAGNTAAGTVDVVEMHALSLVG